MTTEQLNSSEQISEDHTEEEQTTLDQEQPETDQSSEPKVEPPKVDKAQQKIQRRFDRMTKALAEKEASLKALQDEIETYRKSSQPAKEDTSHQPKVDHSSDKPNPDNFATYNEYIEALTDYKLEQKLKSKEVESSQSSRQEKYNQRVETFKQSSPDFSEVVQDVLPLIGNDNDLISYLIDSDHGPEILYKLANDPELLEKFEKGGKIKRSVIIGKIEDELEQPVKKVEHKTKSVPPKPVARVTTASSPTDRVPDENSSFAEWKKYRLSQKKK